MGMNTDAVQRLYVAYFNRPADPVSLGIFEDMLPADREATQAELEALAVQYFSPSVEYAARYSGMSDAQIINTLYQNLFGREAEVDGLIHWTAKLSTGEETFASIALQLSYSAQGTDADAIAAKITAAKAFTTEVSSSVANIEGFKGLDAAADARTWLAAVTDDASATSAVAGVTAAVTSAVAAGAPATAKGVTQTLSTGADSLTSGDTDDTYDASLNSNGNQTLNSLDSIDAGAGTDTLNVQLTGSASPQSLAGVEKVNITASGAATLDLRNADGITDVSVLGSTAATTVNNVPVGTSLAISDTTQDITIGSSGATGGADAASVELASVTGAANVSLAGIEAITINSIAANSIDLVAVDAETLTLTGDSAITIGNMNTSGATEIHTIDASGSTGAVTLTTGNLSQVAPSQDVTITGSTAADDFDVSGHTTSDLSVSGGAGNDRVTAAPGAGDTLSGGEGTDTLELTAAVAAPNANITGFESLQLTGNVSQDADNISGNSIASVTIAATGNAGLTDAPAATTGLVLNSATVGNNTGTITLDLKTDTSDDTVNITAAGATSATVTVNDAETINVSSGIAASTITTMNAADATTLNVTGTEDLTIGTLAGNVNLAKIDATGSTGAVSVAGTANGSLVPMTILAGSGGLTADGSGRDDTVTGGAGIDAIDAGAGNDTLVGNGGADDLDGEAGNDNISGGAGGDTLTVGAGIDTVDGGDGADTIVLAGNYTTLDSIDGGAGTDTVTITTANGSVTPVFTNVEAVTMTAGAGGANTMVLTSSTAVTDVTVADGANVGTVINSLGGGTVTNQDTSNTLTVDTTAGATLTVSAEANNTNALTITDAATVTLAGAAANAGFGSLTLDAVDTTSLTISSAAATFDYDTGVVSGSDQLQTLTVTTAGDAGDITVGDMADGDSLTSLTVTASAGDVDIAEIGGTGGGASGTAEALATITVNASQGGTVVFDEIYADTTNSVTDNDMVITASANDAGSSVAFDDVNNQFGTITATLSGTQAVDFTEGSGTLTADSVTITRSGDGATTIDAVDATTTFTATNNSSGTLTITTADAEGDTVVTTTSGALDVTTTSTDNVTLTGGALADQLIASGTTEAGKTHTLDGAGGADTITGGGGNDVLKGGAGNDTITAGAGVDNIDGGAGDDTITMAANLVSTDTVEGGAGTDNLTASIAANYSGTITGVETFTIDATAVDSGTFSFANIDSEATVILTADTDNDAIALGAMASGTTVRLNDDDVIATLDTVADATLTVDIRSLTAGSVEALTITDAANVTLTTGAAGASSTANVVLDAVDTDTLTVTNPTAIALATGNITGTNVLQSVTTTSSVGSGTIVVGTIADADGLTSVTLTASEADASIGQIGTDATANNAETLTTIDVSASGTGVTATLGDVYLDSTVDSTTDNTVTVTSTSQTGATAALGLIDNTYGTINATYSAEGTNTTTTLTGAAMTITSSGGGSNTISTLNGTGVVSVTSTGSGTFEITDANVDGASASLTVDGSGQTGTVDVIATNSTAAVTLTGGAGADTLTGGSGNDSLVGGAGADVITVNGGFDTVEAGAGNDTITVGGNISLTDNIDGGAGTDTVTATIDTATVHQFGTFNNVETLTLTYAAAGTFKANDASASTINMSASAAVAAIMNNIGTGKTVRLENNNLANVTLDYTADATAVIQLSTDTAVNAGNLVVTDAQTVTIQAHNDDGTAVSHDLGTVTLDATDTDFVTVSSAAAGVTFETTGAFAADDAQTFTVTAGHDGTTLTLGTGASVLATADKLTAITLSAEVENDADIVMTDLGGTAAAAALETVTVTASADSTIASASGADITTGALDAAGADLTSITLSANYTGSVITIGGTGADQVLADSVTTFTVSAVSGATVDVQGGVDITTIGQLSASGAGTVRFDNTDNDTATLERVDSTMTGTFIADFNQTTDVVTYTLGTGTNEITTGTANDVVYLTASGGTDDVNLSTSNTGSITIHNFQVGASADDIELSLVGLKAGTTATDYIMADDGASVGTVAVTSTTYTGVIDFDNQTADTALTVINADVADNTALAKALATAGTGATSTHAITFASAVTDGDAILMLYDNGTDSFLVSVEFNDAAGGANFANNDTLDIADITVSTLITFIGIDDCTTIVDGNFNTIVT